MENESEIDGRQINEMSEISVISCMKKGKVRKGLTSLIFWTHEPFI